MPLRDSGTARDFMRMADMLTERGYRLGPKIGEGTYAKVRVVERSKDGQILAAKIVNRKRAHQDYINKFLPRELKVIFLLDHENIISTHEIIQNADNIFIIMDYAERGDLLDYVRKNGVISNEEAKKMFNQIAKAVKYLHDKNIAHRDLKCENVLIMRDKKIAISDFGFSCPIGKDNTNKNTLCKTFCGSAAYASPELLRGIPYDPKLNDVWSVGCILYIMVCSSMPFDDSNMKKMVHKQLHNSITFPNRVQDKLDHNCKQLIRQMLEPDTSKRISIDQALKSNWLQEQEI